MAQFWFDCLTSQFWSSDDFSWTNQREGPSKSCVKNQQCLVCMPLKKGWRKPYCKVFTQEIYLQEKIHLRRIHESRWSLLWSYVQAQSFSPLVHRAYNTVSGIKVIVFRLCSDFWNRSHIDDLVWPSITALITPLVTYHPHRAKITYSQHNSVPPSDLSSRVYPNR